MNGMYSKYFHKGTLLMVEDMTLGSTDKCERYGGERKFFSFFCLRVQCQLTSCASCLQRQKVTVNH